MRIKYDEQNNIFWIVTGNSLAYMTEDYEVTTIENFPYPDNLDMYADSRGNMWILSSDGIYVVPAEELIANKDIEAVHYGIANGLPCITTSNSYSELTKDGDLYIAGRSGVVKVNIEETFEELSDIKMGVPFVVANGKTIYPDAEGVFTIPSNTKKLKI